MNLHYAIQKLTTQQWNLYNFRFPLTIVVILVVTSSTTGSARLPLDLYFSLCKTKTFFFATHQDPLGYGFSNYNLTNSLWFSCRFKLNEICLTKFQLQANKKNMLNILFHSTLSTLWTSKALRLLHTIPKTKRLRLACVRLAPHILPISHNSFTVSPRFSTFAHWFVSLFIVRVVLLFDKD